MISPQIVTPECFNRIQFDSPGFPLNACGNDGLQQSHQLPLRSNVREIEIKVSSLTAADKSLNFSFSFSFRFQPSSLLFFVCKPCITFSAVIGKS